MFEKISSWLGVGRRGSNAELSSAWPRIRRSKLSDFKPRFERLEERWALKVNILDSTFEITNGDVNNPDVVPRFVTVSDSAKEISTTGTFNWSTGSNWTNGTAPTASDKVRIKKDQIVVVDTATAAAKDIEVQPGGTLRFKNDSGLSTDIELTFDTLTVMPFKPAVSPNPAVDAGKLEIDFNNTANVGTHKAYLTVRNSALRTDTVDASQWGVGLLVFGNATLKGKFTGPTWTAISAGAASLE